MNDADIMNVIVKALKIEAMRKPNERIFVGFKTYTYAEFAEMLSGQKNLSKADKQLIKSFLEDSVKIFKESQLFRLKILELAAEKSTTHG